MELRKMREEWEKDAEEKRAAEAEAARLAGMAGTRRDARRRQGASHTRRPTAHPFPTSHLSRHSQGA
jgi:hypothetical protein